MNTASPSAGIVTWVVAIRVAPPPHDRPAPHEPDLGERRYVSDLQFVHEPAPAEPVWTAD